MRVLHVSAYFAPAFRYGGPPRSILGLCQALVRAGVDVEVFTTTANGDSPLPAAPEGIDYEGVRARYFPLAWPRRLWRAAGLDRALRQSAERADVIHIHGLWNATAWTGVHVARGAGVPYVVSPRGMLQPDAVSRHRTSKRVAYGALERRNLRHASFLHATSDPEAQALRGIGPRVAVIANGVDTHTVTSEAIKAVRRQLDLREDVGVITFLGRVHPIKRLDLVAGAFVRLRRAGRRAVLVVAGPDENGHRAAIEPILREADADVRWTGPIDGEAKWALLGASRAVVQCSDSESFGMSVAEALGAGVPVVVTERGAWGQVAARGCGYVVAHEAAAIAEALGCLVDAPERARAMGARGRAWIEEQFGWDGIGRAMSREYDRARIATDERIHAPHQ